VRVLVTGGTGFVGSHTAADLVGAGHAVRLLVRDREKARRVFAAQGCPLPECVVGDVTDADAVSGALEGCEGVVHAAARVALDAGRAGEVLRTNLAGVENVLGGAARAGLRSIVHVSSLGALFRARGPAPTPDAPVAPGDTPYARSKARAEEVARRLQERGAPVRIVYPSAVVGPEDPGLSEGNRALRTLLRFAVVVTSSGFQAVDVRDLARLHRRLVERADGGGRWLVAGPYRSWSGVADLLDEVTGRRVRRLPCPGVVLRAAGHVGDLAKRMVEFDFPLTAEAMAFATRWHPVDDAATWRELDVTPHPAPETWADALHWLVRAGLLRPRLAGRAAPGAVGAAGAHG